MPLLVIMMMTTTSMTMPLQNLLCLPKALLRLVAAQAEPQVSNTLAERRAVSHAGQCQTAYSLHTALARPPPCQRPNLMPEVNTSFCIVFVMLIC